MNAATSAKPQARRRLAVCLLIAGALHAIVLSGIDVSAPPVRDQARAIELTLVGNMPVPVAAPPPAAQDAVPAAAEVPVQEQPAPPPQAAVDVAAPPVRPADPPVQSITPPDRTVDPPDRAVDPPRHSLAALGTVELARAVADAADADSDRAGGPASRVLRLSDSEPGTPEFAFYLESWRREVQRIGQLNYPRAADGGKLTGSLRLLATIAPDGGLVAARVVESSGHPELDDAAVRIVHLAAPYAPFTPRMRERVDLLEIDRTWRFLRRGVR